MGCAMQFKTACSWLERVQQIQEVMDECNEAINVLALSNTDARAVFFVHIRQLCNTLAYIPIKLQQKAETRGNVPVILALFDLSNTESLRVVLNDLNDNAKLSFLVVTQFAIETAASAVVRAVTGSEPPERFSNLVSHLVEIAGISDSDDKIKRMLLPAYLRNTLHSGGIHSRLDIKFSIGDATFHLRQGERVDCATWSHLLFAISSSIAVVREVFESRTIRNIQSIPVT